MKISKIERVAGIACIEAFIILIVLWVSDGVIGRFLPDWVKTSESEFKRDLYFEPQPYVMFSGTRDPALQGTVGFNRLGYRGPVPVQPKPASEYRIAMIGGSTVLNGAPPTAELLESYFHQDGQLNVHVYNFGVAASKLRMDVARLAFEVSDYAPDLVIFYGGGNDIVLSYQGDPRPGYPPNYFAYENNPLLIAGTPKQKWSTLVQLALLHSRIINLLAGEKIRSSLVDIDQVRDAAHWNSPEWSHEASDAFLLDVRRGAKIAQGFNSKFIFFFQPLLYWKKIPTSTEQALNNSDLSRHANLCRDLMLAGLERLQHDDNIQYEDLSAIFDSTEKDVYVDGIHLLPEFQPKVAKAMYEVVSKLVRQHPTINAASLH